MEKEVQLVDQAAPVEQIDLVATVAQKLLQAGLGQNVLQAYATDPLVLEADDMENAEAQRFLLNRYFNAQLQNLQCVEGITTIDERFCLVPNGTIADWLRLFEQKIIPFCLQYNLPRVI